MLENQEWFYEDGTYYVALRPGMVIRSKLGGIKKKNDGRWEWWRWNSLFHKDWNEGKSMCQGVVKTREEAIDKLLKGWPEGKREKSELNIQKSEWLKK